jgi:parvulin-like peptidyl-prolyl isomerase
MLRSFRQSIVGQLALGAIVLAIILAFALTGSGAGGAASLITDCVVKVGGHCASPKEFQAAYGLLTSIGLSDQAIKRLNLRRQVARGLAERDLLLDRARALGIGTTLTDVDTELSEGRARVSLPAAGAERLALSVAACVDGMGGCEPGTIGLRSLAVKKDGAFDFERYKRTVRVTTGRSTAQFKEMQQAELTAERVREVVRSQVKVSEAEAFLAYERARSQATARVVRVNQSWFARFVLDLSDAVLSEKAGDKQAAVDAAIKGETGFKLGCPVVSEIRLAAKDESDEKAADPALELEALRAKVKTAKDFTAAARRLSVAESAELGGALGCLDEADGADAPALLAAVQGLAPGSVSAVVTTATGPVLLRVDEQVTESNRDALVATFVRRRLVTAELARLAAEDFAKKVIVRLEAGETAENATTAETAALLTDEKHPGRLAADRPLSDISRPFTIEQSPLFDSTDSESPAALVFALDKPDAVVKRPVQIRDGFAILQLKEKDLATKETFKEDRDKVMSQLWSRKAEEALAAFVDELVEKAGPITYDATYAPDDSAESTPPVRK